MEASLIDLFVDWAARNPAFVATLLGPLLVALAGVLLSSRSGASPTPDAAAARAEDATAAAEPGTQGSLPFPESEARTERVEPDVAPRTERIADFEPTVRVEPEVAPRTERIDVVSEPPLPLAEPEPEPVPEPEPEPVRLRDRLRLTSESLVGRLGSLLSGRTVDADVLDELEMMLFQADLGVKTADSLLADVRSKAAGGDAAAVRGVLRDAIGQKLARVQSDGSLEKRGKPHVILVLGVNGAGKTTSIGKLAARYKRAGNKVILGAGDTFRAAAIEQLQAWGERAECEVIAGQSGGDPSAVAFDTVKAATARGADVAIIDTAGRLQTKQPLMEELGKMVRVIGKGLDDAPHEVLLVLDATTGQNAISQAKLFTEVAGVTGLILTKLDGTAKGGVLIGLADEFGIPVKYVGVGETVEDLRDFDAEEFVDAVFAEG
jgi:fused signal recognition particle receptor